MGVNSRILVVPYQYSTSNRNNGDGEDQLKQVVPYQYSTSNRNCGQLQHTGLVLFLISILHQTATARGMR